MWGDAKRVGIKLSPSGGYNDMGPSNKKELAAAVQLYSHLIRELDSRGIGYVQMGRRLSVSSSSTFFLVYMLVLIETFQNVLSTGYQCGSIRCTTVVDMPPHTYTSMLFACRMCLRAPSSTCLLRPAAGARLVAQWQARVFPAPHAVQKHSVHGAQQASDRLNEARHAR